ncbi:NADPH-dependent F420 reductase [Aeromicrobium wangtongii]|uniref:NAD(P)-binding domain-containing protein n=1 Tax=Aeromicrobium wangtongii TaxID=2969247 RepID=A0ABY5MA84_9ACTN|nr:NAD(P)-binding domain-containing protein [Aeromicrobium wangtongii]MCD9199957.1 NAD(P)-binding domain-containing protein [Aeromicrobium wangtongii]UUP13573.1 NAD(P)-binding domain-containing protein [Aeromicrobium wangtongii]
MVSIAVLGTGKVGSALGTKLASAGHQVTYGSRAPAREGGVVSHRDAVAGAEVVITAIPGTGVVGALEAVGAAALGDKIVLDPSAAFAPDMTMAYPGDSVAGRVQAQFPRARVVKTLNTMNFTIMVDPLDSLPDATVFVSGDDADAKDMTRTLLGDLGWPDRNILDLGGIDTALATEHVAPLFFATVRALRSPTFNVTISR